MISPAGSDLPKSTPVIRHRRALILSGGLAGAIIGPAGFFSTTHGGAGVAALARRWHISESDVVFGGSLRLLESGWGALVFLVPGLLTLALMPLFLRWVAAGLTRRPAGFYTRAALGGVGVGVAATAVITWGLASAALWIGTLTTPASGEAALNGAALAIGTLVFAPIVAISVPFIAIRPIVFWGLIFGVAYGALVKRCAAEEASRRVGARDRRSE